MKIYTKTGDDGSTGLLGGARVNKSDQRIDCYGTVDELNAAIGWVAVVATPQLRQMFATVQGELFVIGSHLAAPDQNATASLPTLSASAIARLESQIDSAEQELPALKNFILPGGTEIAARLHLARTICRRAERLTVTLALLHKIDPGIITYLNRLSDWLFVQARHANWRAGEPDVPWSR